MINTIKNQYGFSSSNNINKYLTMKVCGLLSKINTLTILDNHKSDFNRF